MNHSRGKDERLGAERHDMMKVAGQIEVPDATFTCYLASEAKSP